jgi:hypothetical protein
MRHPQAIVPVAAATTAVAAVFVTGASVVLALPTGKQQWEIAGLAVVGALVAALCAAAAGLAADVVGAETTSTEDVVQHTRVDRARLVNALVELVPSLPADVASTATRALADAGVTPWVPNAERFDPLLHRAVGSEPAPSPEQARTIARTERPGFVDRGTPLARPLVVVYRPEERP